MLERKPEIRQHMVQLPSGLGMHGGPENPLGARALYLWHGNKDTLYRIHGTNEPWTIGQNVSSGCIRLTNDDVADLYGRARVGAKVVVLGHRDPDRCRINDRFSRTIAAPAGAAHRALSCGAIAEGAAPWVDPPLPAARRDFLGCR